MRIIQFGRRAVCALLTLVSTSLYVQTASAQIININPVSATGSTNLQPAHLAIDNNGSTRWESNHGVSPSALTLDLGQPYALNQVVILWEAANAASYEILGSNNNSTWTQLSLRTGGTFGNRTDTVPLAGTYRYLRMNALTRSAGNNWGYSIFEMDVFGTLPAASSVAASSVATGNCNLGCVTTLNSTTLRATVTQADIVDIHYRINNGAQQNVRMNVAGGVWTYDIPNLNASSVVSINFTIIRSGAGQDTAWQNYSVNTVASSSRSSVAPSSTPRSSVAPSSTPRSSVAPSSTPRSSVAPSSSSRSSTPVTPSSSSVASLGNIVPLYNSSTVLEGAIQFDRGDALVTRIADRGRDRHAKEDQFQAYDHFLSFYWEHRTATIEIVDYVAKGGNTVRMNVVSQFKLNDTEAENRWFYRGVGTVAEYHDNGTMNVINDLNYYKERSYNAREGRNIQIGDKLEFEMSQFLDHSVPHGRSAYYGTTYLYIVGEGLVPWDVTGSFGTLGGRKDSVKIPEKAWLGGKTTLPYNHSNEPDNHFIQMATNLGSINGQPFVLGRRVHHASFIDGSHDEHVADNGTFPDTVGKAGPRYVNDRCAGCHVRNGRAAPAPVGQPLEKWVFKVADINSNPHPNLGRALQPKSTGGAASEGQVSIAFWTEANGLRKPNYQFSGVTPARFSARVAPQLVGMGLLEAIPETTILAKEDINDANGDGISGRANRIADPATGQTRLGRFGYKAGATSVKHQVAAAFNSDMGVMTSLMPNPDCGSAQTNCGSSGSELSDTHLNNLVKYISTLGVRPQRNLNDAAVQRGETQFASIGCVGCHTPSVVTSQFHPLGELRSQTIKPYTDLLLHDMGADMADNLGEGQASGAEWRTAPLWGLGLSACVTGGVTNAGQGAQVCTPVHSYLHDGRARTIEEAILWHGGEGQVSKNAYQSLSASQKQDVLRFLESL
ncbi:MAG: di-heme oxidoredictase family protein [Cellvibrio sp.]|uniref:di-heme oxidoredictase family protein n=1 Tax=Cellvibrio sp. TaxID=1965322 RepID=UPI00272656D8|nr:di-heme oxidoredictase family protein [Cellvibrio sp.]